MTDGKEIRFRYGEASVHLNSENKFKYENDAGNKLRKGLQNIFNAIKNVDGDQGKLDTPNEINLLTKLQSIFAADGDETISEDEINWAKGYASGSDVVEFINTKYNEINPEQTEETEEEPVVNQSEQAVTVQRPLILDETPPAIPQTPPSMDLPLLVQNKSKESEPVKMPDASKPSEPFADAERVARRTADEGRTVIKKRFLGLFGKKELKYDSEGQLISEKIIRNNGKTRQIIYNEAGKKLREIKRDRNGKIENIHEYGSFGNSFEYNEAGNIIRVVEHNSKGKMEKETTYFDNGKVQYIKNYDGNENQTKLAEYKEDGSLLSVMESDKGKKVKFTDYSSNGLFPHITEYHEDGTITNAVYVEKSESQTGYCVEEYDDNGEKIVKKTEYKHGQPNNTTEYNYNYYGNVIKTSEHYNNHTVREYNDLGIMTKESGDYYCRIYNDNGNIVNSTSFDKNGLVEEYTIYKYDENGTLSKETEYYGNGAVEKNIEYNSDGNPVNRVYYNKDGSFERGTKYQYYDNGLLKERVEYNTNRVTGFSKYDTNGCLTRTNTIIYDCDENGNAIRYVGAFDSFEIVSQRTYQGKALVKYEESNPEHKTRGFFTIGTYIIDRWEYDERYTHYEIRYYDKDGKYDNYEIGYTKDGEGTYG